jgi:transcriptional regulator with XRE-family HTH domain
VIKKVTVTKPRSVTPLDRAIGERIKARRLELHMSQEELGRSMDISFQQIQKYEKGTNRVSAGRLMQISNVLKTSTHYFMEDVEAPRTNGELAFSKFMASRDGVAIIEAMIKITRPSLRAKVIEIAREFAI